MDALISSPRQRRDLVLLRGAPRVLGGQVLPLFPIVLTGKDLSAAPMDEDHPQSWKVTVGAYTNLASQSCVRNLGLERTEWVPSREESLWQCQWSD